MAIFQALRDHLNQIILINKFFKVRIPDFFYSSYLISLILNNIKFEVSRLNNAEINISKEIFKDDFNIKDRWF